MARDGEVLVVEEVDGLWVAVNKSGGRLRSAPLQPEKALDASDDVA